MTRRLLSAIAMLALLCACGGDGGVAFVAAGEDAPADYLYTVPAGAVTAWAQGEPLEIMPRRLEVRVGETIEIVNEDDRGVLVGPFFIRAGETVRYEFAGPGELVGFCQVHPSGRLELIVREP